MCVTLGPLYPSKKAVFELRTVEIEWIPGLLAILGLAMG